MKQTVKWLAAALIALGLNQAVWADDVSDFRENLQAAAQGNVAAQFNLGVMYENGQGVRQDYVQAVQWYRKASEQGDAQAQYNLGLMYYDGRGVRQDDGNNPKADDDLGFFPAFLFVVVVDRCHQEDAFFGFLVPADLKHNGHGFDDEQTAHNH